MKKPKQKSAKRENSAPSTADLLSVHSGRSPATEGNILSALEKKANADAEESSIILDAEETGASTSRKDKLDDKDPKRPFDEKRIRQIFRAEGLSEKAADAALAAIANASFDSELPKPGKIPLYTKRKDRSVDAITFYDTHWKKFADAGLLYRHMLRQRDLKLYEAIYSYCKNREIDPETVMPPTKSQSVDDEINASGITSKTIKRWARHIERKEAKNRANTSPIVEP